MREILFRGKRLDNGEWVEGYYARKGADEESYKHNICVSNFHSDYQSNLLYPFYFVDYEVDPESVGQYTGLNDMSDKRIFEGDILSYNGCHYKVLFFAGYARFAPTRDAYLAKRFGFQPFCGFDMRCAEVIGNIHDNPELLKGE